MSLHSPIINDKNASVKETACFLLQDQPHEDRANNADSLTPRDPFHHDAVSKMKGCPLEQPFRSSFHYPYIRYIGKPDIVNLLKPINDMKLLGGLIIIMDPAD